MQEEREKLAEKFLKAQDIAHVPLAGEASAMEVVQNPMDTELGEKFVDTMEIALEFHASRRIGVKWRWFKRFIKARYPGTDPRLYDLIQDAARIYDDHDFAHDEIGMLRQEFRRVLGIEEPEGPDPEQVVTDDRTEEEVQLNAEFEEILRAAQNYHTTRKNFKSAREFLEKHPHYAHILTDRNGNVLLAFNDAVLLFDRTHGNDLTPGQRETLVEHFFRHIGVAITDDSPRVEPARVPIIRTDPDVPMTPGGQNEYTGDRVDTMDIDDVDGGEMRVHRVFTRDGEPIHWTETQMEEARRLKREYGE